MTGSSMKPSSSTPRQHNPDLSCERSGGGGLGTLTTAARGCFIEAALGQLLARFHGICQSCWKKLSTSSTIVQLGEEDNPTLSLLVAIGAATKSSVSFTFEPCPRSLTETLLLSSPTAMLDDLEPVRLMQLSCPSWLLHSPPGLVSTSLESTCLLGELQQIAETELVSSASSSEHPLRFCMSIPLRWKPPPSAVLAMLAG
jgi:hypothetical protein